jgi:hypothetical protein
MQRHFQNNILILASPEKIFNYINDHTNLSSHMQKSSWLMGGSKMNIELDKGEGKQIGSHIKMTGKIFGISLFLDEEIIQYNPPNEKSWKTVGDIRLLVIGHYILGFSISSERNGSKLTVFIDYQMPSKNYWLGYLFGNMYAKWCVNRMLKDTAQHFSI